MKSRLCAWGDCNNDNVAVTVNYHGYERPAFCCEEHAAIWLLQRAKRDHFASNEAVRNVLSEAVENLTQAYSVNPERDWTRRGSRAQGI